MMLLHQYVCNRYWYILPAFDEIIQPHYDWADFSANRLSWFFDFSACQLRPKVKTWKYTEVQLKFEGADNGIGNDLNKC